MTGIDFVFIVAAVVCALSALAIVSQKNPVYSVVYMLPFFLGMTTLFVLLQATFLAAIQMIVYGGAILVVFLFVIMLINLKPEELKDDFSAIPWTLTTIGAAMLGAAITVFVRRGVEPTVASHVVDAAGTSQQVADNLNTAFALPLDPSFGTVNSIAAPLFKNQVVPFELASVLIVVAILGAVLLSKKKV